jgi:hypothetical protein
MSGPVKWQGGPPTVTTPHMVCLLFLPPALQRRAAPLSHLYFEHGAFFLVLFGLFERPCGYAAGHTPCNPPFTRAALRPLTILVQQSQLQTLHSAISFHIGPLPALVEEFGVKSATHMREVIRDRLLTAAIDEKSVM